MPVAKSVLEENAGVDAPGVVVLKYTDTAFAITFVKAISGFPSPFKSPIVKSCGCFFRRKICSGRISRR